MSIQAVITNWAEIFWGGGCGELVQPKFANKWVAESCMYCENAEENPAPIDFPKELIEHVKLSNYRIVKGRYVIVPMPYKLSGVGSLVATGSTMEKAIENCRDVMKEVTGFRLNAADSFEKAGEAVAKMQEFGVSAFG